MPQQFLRILQISAASALVVGLSLTQPAQASRDCPGFQVYRDRNDREAPVLPRSSTAAIAIQSPGGCDRSSEEKTKPQPHQTAEPARQHSAPIHEATPSPEQPADQS